MVYCIHLGVSDYNFKNKLSEELFLLSNNKHSKDPDTIPLNATFHLGFHCLQKYQFDGVSSVYMVKTMLQDKQYNS